MTYSNSSAAIERAFELTKSGEYSSIDHIRLQLQAEGLQREQITGSTLHCQLRDLIQSAQNER